MRESEYIVLIPENNPLQYIMKQSEVADEFTNLSAQQEDEIHIIQQPKQAKPQAKRKKEESVFKQLPEMDNLSISLIGYEKESFLKIQTQIYKLEIRDTQTDAMWIIRRRYSDVLWLHEVVIEIIQSLTIDHIGYILPFFPNKTLESFFTAKINIGLNKQRKDDFILERTEVINDFLRKIYGHPELKYSDEARIFLLRVDSDFLAEKKKIEAVSDQYKQMETNSTNFLGLIEKGTTLLSSYMGTKKLARQITKQDMEFETYQQKVIESGNTTKMLAKNIEDLALLKKQQAEAAPLQGEQDKLELINTRMHLSREPNLNLADSLSSRVMRPLNRLCFWIQQVKTQLQHRKSVIQFTFSLKQNIDDISRIRKLERRIEKFENNFRKTWEQFNKESQEELASVIKLYNDIWANYAKGMSKIWK